MWKMPGCQFSSNFATALGRHSRTVRPGDLEFKDEKRQSIDCETVVVRLVFRCRCLHFYDLFCLKKNGKERLLNCDLQAFAGILSAAVLQRCASGEGEHGKQLLQYASTVSWKLEELEELEKASVNLQKAVETADSRTLGVSHRPCKA